MTREEFLNQKINISVRDLFSLLNPSKELFITTCLDDKASFEDVLAAHLKIQKNVLDLANDALHPDTREAIKEFVDHALYFQEDHVRI